MWWEPLIKFGPALAAFAAVFGGFSKLEDVVSPEAKASITASLQYFASPRSRDTRKPANLWPVQFAALLDTVFGKTNFSWKCFYRSCAVSLTLFAFSYLIVFSSSDMISSILHPDTSSFRDNRMHVEMVVLRQPPFFLLLFGTFLMFGYFSLLKTRFIMHRMVSLRSLHTMILALLLDVVFTYSIWYAFVWSINNLLLIVSRTTGNHTLYYIYVVVSYVWTNGYFFKVQLFIQLFTPMWAFLFGASVIISNLLATYRWFLRSMVWFFDIKTKPIQSIGYVAGIICAVVTYIVTVAL